MPNLDKTGPQGVGPTGLRKGGCVAPSVQGLGRGRGQGRGRGRGLCPYYVANSKVTLEEEQTFLKARLEAIEKELQEIKE